MQLAVEIASDVIVTSTIAYCLWKSRTGWSGTDKLIGRLLRYVSPPHHHSGADQLGSSSRPNSHLPSCKSLFSSEASDTDTSAPFSSWSSFSLRSQAQSPVSSRKYTFPSSARVSKANDTQVLAQGLRHLPLGRPQLPSLSPKRLVSRADIHRTSFPPSSFDLADENRRVTLTSSGVCEVRTPVSTLLPRPILM
jgi:hypothetical protein